MAEPASAPLAPARFLRVVLPVPVRHFFDYAMPELPVYRGQRIRVPFGRRQLIGIAVHSGNDSDIADERIRPVTEVLKGASISEALLDLLLWAADYYHHPPGEAVFLALPPSLRQRTQVAARAMGVMATCWQLSDTAPALEDVAQAPKQRMALGRLAAASGGLLGAELSVAAATIRTLLARGWIVAAKAQTTAPPKPSTPEQPLALSDEQARAVAAIVAAFDAFQCLLLEGVTGSGKTEVYLQASEHCLRFARTVLVLTPEIGLTPQIRQRFEARFPGRVAVIHSGLSAAARQAAWLAVAQGQVDILLGTRAALFTPMPSLGLIVIDEEHDSSYRQRGNLHHSARDLAIKLASDLRIPIVLGSATPSLESLANVDQKGYQHVHLSRRATDAPSPQWRLVDMRALPKEELLAAQTASVIQEHLARGGQVLVFINRRGIAPILMCADCGWMLDCSRCDAHMVLHRAGSVSYMLCHHCTRQIAVPNICAACRSGELFALGAGVQRFEALLQCQFPDHEILRFDTDVSPVKRLRLLLRAQHGRGQILIGTQMLSKGHDFPNLTLTVVADADLGLFAADFRAAERMAQLITQVAGRAGRARPGLVLIQTRNPDHPILQTLLESGYRGFAKQALAERLHATLPPYAHLAMFRAEAKTAKLAQASLARVATLARTNRALARSVELWGPVPAPMERKAGLFRQQMMFCAKRRDQLQQMLHFLVARLESDARSRRGRWSVEVDPIDLY